MEEWKDIVGFEGCYQISSLGRIRRLDTLIPFSGKLSIRRGRLMKTTKNSKGYSTIVLCWKSKRKTYNVHRLVASTFLPNPENKSQVNHIDGNPLNNAACNLEWCTPAENQLHAYDTGLKGHGSKAGMSKLKEEDVLIIRHMLTNETKKSKHSIYTSIAKQFNVSHTSIKWIDKGRTWRRVTGED